MNVQIKSFVRRSLMKFSLSLLLLVAVAAPKASAQDSFLTDRTLSQLRGVWEYRTYRDKWTLVFESDHKMILDREPADYSLIPEAIRVQDGNGSTDYPYNFDGTDLTLTLPDGSTRTYRKSDAGEAEKLVHGTYYTTTNASLPRESLLFDGDHSFVFDYPAAGDTGEYSSTQDHRDRRASMSEIKGVYRVEGEMLVLAFDDSSTSESQIRNRDDDNSVADIVFQDQVFETIRPVVSAGSDQSTWASQPIPTPISDPYPPPTCCGPILVPPPARPITPPSPISPPAPSNAAKKAVQTESKPRDFGNTRSTAGAR
ncbi:MAG: hypothetical protein E6K56_03225 [Ignavibacteria bacterium]|nr:MAG: hypothetical protein E6K56_03225 [Ignavibacteria bacterium]